MTPVTIFHVLKGDGDFKSSCVRKAARARKGVERVGPLEKASECRTARGFRMSAVGVRQRWVIERLRISFRWVSHVLCSVVPLIDTFFPLSPRDGRLQHQESAREHRQPGLFLRRHHRRVLGRREGRIRHWRFQYYQNDR